MKKLKLIVALALLIGPFSNAEPGKAEKNKEKPSPILYAISSFAAGFGLNEFLSWLFVQPKSEVPPQPKLEIPERQARHLRNISRAFSRSSGDMSPLAALINDDMPAVDKLLEKPDSELLANTKADLQLVRDMHEEHYKAAEIIEVRGQNAKRVARRERQWRAGRNMRRDILTVFPDEGEVEFRDLRKKGDRLPGDAVDKLVAEGRQDKEESEEKSD